jgi:hypothetical protein
MKKTLAFIVLLSFLGITAEAQLFSKKKTKKETIITRHPDPISIKGSEEGKNFFFFVTDVGLFFTDDEELSSKIAEHLPDVYSFGKAVELEGSRIRAFTKFKKEQLGDISRKTGKKINKRKDVFVITGHSFLTNYNPTKKPKPSSDGTMKYNSPGN